MCANIRFNNEHLTSTVLGDTPYNKFLPEGFYYSGIIINQSTKYDVIVTLITVEDFTIGPITLQPVSKIDLKSIGIKNITLEGNLARVAYNLVGNTLVPPPGSEQINIIPYSVTGESNSIRDLYTAPSDITYDSQYVDTTTLTSAGYNATFPNTFYYNGYLVNSSSLYSISVTITKSDGTVVGPLNMETTTRLSLKAFNVGKIEVTGTGATFRYDFIGSSQIPLSGSESIDIIPYQKIVSPVSISLSGGNITAERTILYTIPEGYKLIIHSATVIMNTDTTSGNRRALIALENAITLASFGNYSAILCDTATQTGTVATYAGSGSPAQPDTTTTSIEASLPINTTRWGSDITAGYYTLGSYPIAVVLSALLQSGDEVVTYTVDMELLQV